MSLLIEGINLPEAGKPVVLHIASNGKVYANVVDSGITTEHTAVEVPPHERLIDAAELHSVLRQKSKEFSDSEYGEGVKDGLAYARECVVNAPTIIHADQNEELQQYEAAVENAQYCEIYEPTYDPDTGAM